MIELLVLQIYILLGYVIFQMLLLGIYVWSIWQDSKRHAKLYDALKYWETDFAKQLHELDKKRDGNSGGVLSSENTAKREK